MRVAYLRVRACVRACGQERELFMRPATSAPDRNMDKQQWDSRLRADGEAEQSIDLQHRKWKFPVAVKVRAVYVCVRACDGTERI